MLANVYIPAVYVPNGCVPAGVAQVQHCPVFSLARRAGGDTARQGDMGLLKEPARRPVKKDPARERSLKSIGRGAVVKKDRARERS